MHFNTSVSDPDPDVLPLPAKIESDSAVIYMEYDLETLPPKPDSSWTRFVLLSDTHDATFEIPPGDVLLHSGDLTEVGTYEELRNTMEWLYAQPHPVKM